MPTTSSSSSSSPSLSPSGSSTGTPSSHALSTPSSSTSLSIPSTTDAHTITSTASRGASVVNGPTPLHKRAPPSSSPPLPARFHQMHNLHSSPSSASSSPSTPSTSNKLIKREHPTLGTLHDLQPSANKPQGNRLRKTMHNADSHKIGLSFNDPDEVVSIADDGYLPADSNSPLPRSATSPQVPPTVIQTATVAKAPPRPEPVRQQSYSKRHASFDTPRMEVPLPFFSEPFPRELDRHQQRCAESGETPEPPCPTRNSRGPSVSQPRPPSPSPPLNRNNSAPTPPSSPSAASTNVQDLQEAESLRDHVEREDEKEAPWPSIVPGNTTPPSSEKSIGRRSTASLPLPGEHAGEPLHRLNVRPPTSGTFSTSPSLHPLSSIPASASFTAPRAFSLPPPPPPAAPEISAPPTTLHPLLDIPSSVSSSASNTPPQAHANVSTQSYAPPPSTSASATPYVSQPTTPTTNISTAVLNSPPPSHPFTATTIATGPQGPHMTVQTTSTAYILQTTLPGYQRDEITLSTRKKRVLHVVADPFISSSRGTGHFERRISFGYDADMAHIRAEFNGSVLKIVVPRRPTVSAPAGYDPQPGLGLGGHQGNAWSSADG